MMADEIKTIHVGILTGPIFAIPYDKSLRQFIEMARSQGFVETDTLHLPYHAITFIGVPSSQQPTGQIFHLVPKE